MTSIDLGLNIEHWESAPWAFETPEHGLVFYITENYHQELVRALSRLHQHDIQWAQDTALAHGIDLAALADADPDYRAEFRT